ncbi:hypothetical protein SAMN02983003_2947 [Devosia enhydra]|uniref:Uncharacterized protein n=1 Tax=Devosia enhydra TaxID=665118 RepID=A0A1K2I0C5_9HYPH|nr:hypothetical protein [Devosia enhydra]SFZ85777.1 hypothetical protein SAMN02983003_2947 [Devosia enhydra]
MSATPFLSLSCPHCLTRVNLPVRRLRPGGCLPCPDCASAIFLDEQDPEIAQALVEARQMRAERRRERNALRDAWRDQGDRWRLPGGDRPMPDADIPDLLAGLDRLMGRLDQLLASPSR